MAEKPLKDAPIFHDTEFVWPAEAGEGSFRARVVVAVNPACYQPLLLCQPLIDAQDQATPAPGPVMEKLWTDRADGPTVVSNVALHTKTGRLFAALNVLHVQSGFFASNIRGRGELSESGEGEGVPEASSGGRRKGRSGKEEELVVDFRRFPMSAVEVLLRLFYLGKPGELEMADVEEIGSLLSLVELVNPPGAKLLRLVVQRVSPLTSFSQ